MLKRSSACVAFAFLTAAGCSAPKDEFGHRLDCARNGELIETGHATWYGDRFQGRTTASGETFDLALPTAAHNSLPFGSEVMIVNENNNLAVRVVINDRGRFKRSSIDLSQEAMDAIGGVTAGRVPVRIYQCNRREMRLANWE